MNTSVEVYCTLEVEGTHAWSNCPHEEVKYLRYPHRHLFGIRAYKTVTHSDRDCEFIMLKHQILKYLTDKYDVNMIAPPFCEFGDNSCEMIASELITQFGLSRCEVNEDGENGAIVTVESVQ